MKRSLNSSIELPSSVIAAEGASRTNDVGEGSDRKDCQKKQKVLISSGVNQFAGIILCHENSIFMVQVSLILIFRIK